MSGTVRSAVVLPEERSVVELRVRRRVSTDCINAPAGGQGLAEYALILALVAMVAISGLIFLGEFWAMPDITDTPADSVEY